MKTIFKNSVLFCVSISLFLITSCSAPMSVTSDYSKDTNFAQYKTFDLYKLSTTGSVSKLNADRIANAIRNEMIKKGYKEDKKSPDIMINAVAVLKDKQEVTATTNYYGYGGLYRPYGFYGGMGMGVANTSVNTYNYKAGSFIIDIVEVKSNKAIWQGTGTKDFDNQLKDPDTEIPAGVSKIMASYPQATN